MSNLYNIYDASQDFILKSDLNANDAQEYYNNAWRDGVSAMMVFDQNGKDVTDMFESNDKRDDEDGWHDDADSHGQLDECGE